MAKKRKSPDPFDECLFCGTYMDPIGCDVKKGVNGGTWCGQCPEGRVALFGHWAEWEVEMLRDLVKEKYDEDPIDWNPKTKEPKGNDALRHATHLRKLWMNDFYQTLDQVLKDRKKDRSRRA